MKSTFTKYYAVVIKLNIFKVGVKSVCIELKMVDERTVEVMGIHTRGQGDGDFGVLYLRKHMNTSNTI